MIFDPSRGGWDCCVNPRSWMRSRSDPPMLVQDVDPALHSQPIIVYV